ncbi:MAG: hypothetical protein ACTSWY_11620 [Promethearchaeota archaeon]
MHISEIGIIVNGLTILNQSYGTKLNIDNDLRDSLLDAILKMTEFVMSENIQNFNFGKYKLIVLSQNLVRPQKPDSKAKKDVNMNKVGRNTDTDLVVYGIGDKDVNVKIIQGLLKKVYNEFIKMFPKIGIKPIGDITPFRAFKSVFDDILSDLSETAEERFGSIF